LLEYHGSQYLIVYNIYNRYIKTVLNGLLYKNIYFCL